MTKNRISIAIAALGGQGGGVLSNWIVNLAEDSGYLAQYTAIAGVAQRTGATIYAIELFPEGEMTRKGKEPVLALMPVSGDVDICIASELMEAGRAVNRGIVTPEKTTLITSDHRVYAIEEKEQLADGRFKDSEVRDVLRNAAKELIIFDMEELVLQSSSVISSVLFGALAGSDALPFSREAFEDTIRKSGRSVDTNLNGFNLGFNAAIGMNSTTGKPCGERNVIQNGYLQNRIDALSDEAKAIATYGVHRLVDYQDAAYADLYLERLENLRTASGDLLAEVARYLALWMGFDDVIRVADLKTRAERSKKIASEIRAADNQIWYDHDYFHPRYEEFIDVLPRALGHFMDKSKIMRAVFSPLFSAGRIIRPKTISGFLLLRFVAGLRFMRLKSRKYYMENKRITAWLDLVGKYGSENPELAMQIALCPRIIKGYGETHTRGINRFSRIMSYIEENGDDPELFKKTEELRDAALADEKGDVFRAMLADFNAEDLNFDDGKNSEFKWAGSS